jgi:hypothetical protein
MSSREGDVIAHEIKKAGDPTEKPGLIGAFCRTYTIEDVITRFSATATTYSRTRRYTYKLGSVPVVWCATKENTPTATTKTDPVVSSYATPSTYAAYTFSV